MQTSGFNAKKVFFKTVVKCLQEIIREAVNVEAYTKTIQFFEGFFLCLKCSQVPGKGCYKQQILFSFLQQLFNPLPISPQKDWQTVQDVPHLLPGESCDRR